MATIGNVVLAILVAALVVTASRYHSRRLAAEKVGNNVDLTNMILRSWALYARDQNIEGLPVNVEVTWSDAGFARLEEAAVIIEHNFRETKYKIAKQEQGVRDERGRWDKRATFTFTQADE